MDKYVCSSEILSAFEFFIRYYHDDRFKKGIQIILNYYKGACSKNKAETWEIILSTYEIMLDVDNKMYNIRKEKVDFTDDDSYDKMMKIFRKIGDTLEISTKQLIRELYALANISYNKNINYNVIKNQSLGTIVSEILNFDNLTFLFLIEPSNLKLSDWRNISYHHTYFLDNQNNVNCKYGNKNQYNIKMSLNELVQYAHKIMRTCNILSIARTIFITDNIDYVLGIKNNNEISSISLRQKLKVQQFKTSLLSQEFELKNVILSDKKVEIDLFDLQKEAIVKERIIHCLQLLYNTWAVWEKSLVYINYYNYENKKICHLFVEGRICELIATGKKELEYLANKFEIEII